MPHLQLQEYLLQVSFFEISKYVFDCWVKPLDPLVHFDDRREFFFLGFGDGSVKLFDIRTPEAGVATFSDLQSPILDCRLQVHVSCTII